MNKSSMTRFALTALVVGAMAVPAVAQAGVGIRIGGRIHVNVGSSVRPHRYVVVRPRRHVHVSAGVGVGLYMGGYYYGYQNFAEPPPPVEPIDCEPQSPAVNAYYVPPAQPAPVYVEPEAPRFGLGLFAGSVNVADQQTASDVGVLAKYRLTRSLELEGELAKSELEDGTRVDRRMGLSLVWNLSPSNRLTPYLLMGAGGTRVDVDGGSWSGEQSYGELGAGLSYKVSPRFVLAGDLRAGSRSRVDSAPEGVALKSVAPSSENDEAFSRGRISAILMF